MMFSHRVVWKMGFLAAAVWRINSVSEAVGEAGGMKGKYLFKVPLLTNTED